MLFAVIADAVVYVNDAIVVTKAALLVLAIKLRRDCLDISWNNWLEDKFMYLIPNILIRRNESKICFKFNIIDPAFYTMDRCVRTLILSFFEKTTQMEIAIVRVYGHCLVDNNRLPHLYI